MGEAIGGVLGYAIGVAVSPVPIAAVILMLFSRRARSNSTSFLAGWIFGIAVASSIVLVIPGLEADDRTPSDGTGWTKLALGAALLVLGAWQWWSRPRGNAEAEPPGWMDRVDGLTPPAAFGLGFALAAINPKNLVLAVAAGATIASLPLDGGEAAGVVAIFTAVAAVSVVVPVVAYLVSGQRLDRTLELARAWLIANNQAVMAVLFIVFSVSLAGDGIEILSS
ncbi:MAG: GAP family protein [Actinomycetota bacterium]